MKSTEKYNRIRPLKIYEILKRETDEEHPMGTEELRAKLQERALRRTEQRFMTISSFSMSTDMRLCAVVVEAIFTTLKTVALTRPSYIF